MRGQVFSIEGTKIFTMGGGESPDIDIRFEMDTWSDLEIPTREELVEGVENLQKYGVPVVVTLNSFVTDTEAEYEFIRNFCEERGWTIFATAPI